MTFSKQSVALPVCVLAYALSINAIAQETNEGDVAELSAIKVKGAELNGPEISTTKLLKVPGAGNDPLKAVEALPGVVLGGFGPFSIPAVRGSSPRDNTYITDFVPVGYVFHNDGNSTYNDNLIENFDLKAGAWDAQYNDAIGAVLSTKLRDPYQAPISTTLDLSFLRAGALVEGAVTDDSAFYFSYRQSLLEFYVENFIDEEELTFTEVPKNNDYQFKYHWQLSPVSNLRFIATGAEDSVGIDFGPESDALETEPGLAGGLGASTYYHNQGILFDTLLSGGTSTMFSFSRKEEDASFSIGSLFDLDAINIEHRIKNYYGTPLKNGDTLRYGFDVASIQLDYEVSGKYVPCNQEVGDICPPASLGYDFGPLTDTLNIHTVYSFIAYDWLASSQLDITFGLGYGVNDFNDETLIQPKISARYRLNDTWTLTGAMGQHSQFIREFRFIAEELGNPDLKQPISNHFIAGFEHQYNDSLSTKLEVYYKTIDNLIAANSNYDFLTNNTVPPYLNIASGEAYGLELLINQNLTDKWYGWLSVAYSQTKRQNDITLEEIDYELDRPWIINLVANYQSSPKTSYGFKWRYQSGNLITPVTGATPFDENGNALAANTDIEDVYIYDPIEGDVNSQRLSDYHRLDFRMDHDFSTSSTLYFEIVNLYNRANVSDYSYNKDYSEKEEVTSLPIIFSIGTKLVF